MLKNVIGVNFGKQWNKNNYEWSIAHYWGQDHYWIDKSDTDEVISLFRSVYNQSKPSINKGINIYASKASETPRFKLKEFIKEKGLKKTSRHQYADVIIINKGYLNQLMGYFKIKEIDFVNEHFAKNQLKKLILKTNNTANSSIDTYNNATDFNTLGYIATSKDSLKRDFKSDKTAQIEYENNIHTESGMLFNFYREKTLMELFNIIIENKERIKKGKVKFVFDEDFIIDLNQEGIELDDDYLQTLRDMLFSSDEANVKLGFEMISNLVIDQPTLLSISFLLNELITTTRFRPSYYASSNSNLKNLLKMFKTKGIHWDKDWKTFGTGLRLNFKDGKEGDIVKKFLLDNINREFKLSNSASEALVDIVFTTEVKELSLV